MSRKVGIFVEIFQERVRECRRKAGLTQQEAAEQMGMVFRTYRRYECGEAEPPLPALVKIADFYGVSLDYLAGRSEG